MENVFWLWVIFGALLMGVAGYNLAKKKNRNGYLWFFNCISLGLLGLLVLACSTSLDDDEDSDYDITDLLGWWMFVIGLIWFVVGFYYGFTLVEEYNRQRAWSNINYFLSL